jgi:hypothetical protein
MWPSSSEEETLKRVSVHYCEQRVVDIMNKGIDVSAKTELIKKIHDGDYKKVKGSVGCAVMACSRYEGGVSTEAEKWIQGDGMEKAVEESDRISRNFQTNHLLLTKTTPKSLKVV